MTGPAAVPADPVVLRAELRELESRIKPTKWDRALSRRIDQLLAALEEAR